MRTRLPTANAAWNRRWVTRAGEAEVARRGVGRLHLTEDLRLADDQRVEAGGDAEEMARRVDAAVAVEVRRQPRRVEAVIVARRSGCSASAAASESPTA